MPDIYGNPYSWEQPTAATSTAPTYQQPTFGLDNYGMGSAAANSVNLAGTPNPNEQLGTFGFNAQPNNITGTDQSLYQNLINTPQVAPESLFGGVTGSDWLGFGTDIAGLGLGAYYQNQALDQSQQQLDLAQAKYDTYQQEQADLDKAYANFG